MGIISTRAVEVESILDAIEAQEGTDATYRDVAQVVGCRPDTVRVVAMRAHVQLECSDASIPSLSRFLDLPETMVRRALNEYRAQWRKGRPDLEMYLSPVQN